MERGREQYKGRKNEAFSCRRCVHTSGERKLNHRNAYQDYHAPAFYMITMTTLERRPLFATCADNKATLIPNRNFLHAAICDDKHGRAELFVVTL